MLCMFLAGATGGGDVKLATALGAFLGPEIGLSAIAWCHVLAGLYAVVWILCKVRWTKAIVHLGQYLSACWVAQRLISVRFDRRVAEQRLPMAAFFGLGVCVALAGFRLW